MFLMTTLPNKILDLLPICNFSPTNTFAPKNTSLPILALLRIEVLDPKSENDPILTL